MSRETWTHLLSPKLGRKNGWRMAVILAFALLLGAISPLRVVATDQGWSVATPGLERLSDHFRWVLYRLISAVPPAQRVVRKPMAHAHRAVPTVAGMREPRAIAGSQSTSAPAQDHDRLAARKKFDEGEALRAQGTAESLRLAVKKYEEALLLLQAIGDRKWEARMLKNIGDVYRALGERQYQDHLADRKKFDVGEALRAQGTAEFLRLAVMKYESLRLAVKKYEEALLLWRDVGDSREEAATLSNIGDVYDLLGENQKALDFYTQALPLYRAAGDRSGEAAILYSISVIYDSLGERQKALDFYTQALPLYRAAGDRSREAAILYSISVIYDSLGEQQKALDFYTQALPLYRAVGDRSGEAAILYSISVIYESLGERKKALDYYTQALSLRRTDGDRSGEAATLHNIGAVYDSLGERQKALDYFTQALSLYRVAGDRFGEAGTLFGIGAVYDSLGDRRKALDFYTWALPLYRAVRDRGGEVTTIASIGAANDLLGERQKALDSYEEARMVARWVGDRNEKAAALIDIGLTYHELGERKKALDLYTQALSIHRAAGDRSGEAKSLIDIGAMYDSPGERKKALDFYTQALPLYRAGGDRDREASIPYFTAYAKRVLGRFDESRSHIESALKISESIRAKVVSKELRISYLAKAQKYYEFYIDLLMRMHSQEPAKGHIAAALEASERARARSLLESLTEARADIRRGADPKLLEQERSLQKRLNAKAEEEFKISASGADEARLATIKREMDALTIELQQAQTQILQTSPRYAALTQPQPLNLAEIQRQAIDADTLLLEYSLGEERSFLWAVTPTTIKSYVLPRREEIEAAAQRVYALLSDAPGVKGPTAKPRDLRLEEARGQYLASAASLSRTLLAPVASHLGKKRLLIVADGMLHYVPFGALPDPNSPKWGSGSWQPLVVRHEIVNLPSASTIAILRRELAGRKPAPKTLAALADPVFSKDDERIKSGVRAAAMQTAPPNPLNEALLRKLAQITGAASTPDDLRINRLPFTRLEAERIMALVPVGAGMKALDFDASRATATSAQLSQYRYVHFATHGLADSERPELSALALSLYDEQGRPQDGFLRAHEVLGSLSASRGVVLMRWLLERRSVRKSLKE